MASVEIGQVYEETDPRAAGRRFIVVDIEESKAVVRTIRADGVMEARTRIRLDRLRPTLGARGYRLIPSSLTEDSVQESPSRTERKIAEEG